MNWLLTILVKIICFLVALTPRSLQILVGRFLGSIWFYIIPIRKKVAFENVKRAFPDWPNSKINSMLLRNYQNYACGVIELLLLPYFSKKLFNKLIVVENKEYYDDAFKKGQGVFLLSLHLGSWELMSACNEHLGIPAHVITKKFKTQGLNQIWVKLRLGRGIKLISEEKSTFQILRVIRDGEVVGFILDQFMGPPAGVKTRFFGHETGTAGSLALFSDRTRAPVVPVYCVRREDGRISIVFEPEIPFMEQGSTAENIAFMTQVYTNKIEAIVKKYPDQWLWIHRRWKPFRH